MNKKGIFLAALGILIATNSFAGPFSYIKNNIDGSQTLTGHVPLDVKTAAFKNHANININARIILPLGNQSQLSSFLQDLYNPKSPNFHHFLTPAQFAQEFGPSTIDLTIVQEFLKKAGIYVLGRSANGTILNVTGPVSAFEQAFGLHINNYQKSDGTLFFAPDADPMIPANLAGKILAVGGLDDLPKYKAHAQPLTGALPKATGSGPGGFLAPGDVKAAYNLNPIAATGAGQNIAVFELDGYSINDIAVYDKQFGLPGVNLQNILIDNFSGVPNYGSNGGADEVTLDIELVTAFAPGASNILVYEAPNTTQSWMDEWTRIATDDKAKVTSCSWGEPELDSPTLSFDNTIFQQMAAQGQAVFVASGDNGAYDAGGKTLAVDEPASQPFATAVGISKLTTNSGGAYSSESASVYGGGGVSAYWSMPSYQATLAAQAVAAAKVSKTMRNLPDVVLTADASTGYAFYIDGSWGGWYGSSIASPIWASFISLVDQGLGTSAPIGSVNSALYQLAQTTSYANDFHDITTGNNGYYPAEPGFDDATGLGSFNGANLYGDLIKNAVPVSAPATPSGLSATAGNAQVLLSWNASLGANSYSVGRSAANSGPYTIIASPIVYTTYTDNSVKNGTTYYYEVSAANSIGSSAPSAAVSATPELPPPSTVAAPANLKGSATTYRRSPAVSLQWTQSISPNIRSNNVYYSISGGSYIKLGGISATTAVTITGLSGGVTYGFYVTAVNSSAVESPASNKITVVTPLVKR